MGQHLGINFLYSFHALVEAIVNHIEKRKVLIFNLVVYLGFIFAELRNVRSEEIPFQRVEPIDEILIYFGRKLVVYIFRVVVPFLEYVGNQVQQKFVLVGVVKFLGGKTAGGYGYKYSQEQNVQILLHYPHNWFFIFMS